MISFQDPHAEEKIRAELRKLSRANKLGVLAALSGIAGGERELRRLMESNEPMSIMDIGMIALALDNVAAHIIREQS